MIARRKGKGAQAFHERIPLIPKSVMPPKELKNFKELIYFSQDSNLKFIS